MMLPRGGQRRAVAGYVRKALASLLPTPKVTTATEERESPKDSLTITSDTGMPATRPAQESEIAGYDPLLPPMPASREEVPLHPAEKQPPRPMRRYVEEVEDPVVRFILQGRELLADMHDGGNVSVIADTGVEGVWCIQLENAENGNAITGEMMLGLEEALRKVNRAIKTNHELLCVIIRGGGMNFSFGTSATLHQEKYHEGEGGVLSRYMHTLMLELSSLPVPTIAAIEGVAAGTGLELAAACDFRIMSSDGMLQFADTHSGLCTGWGGAARIARMTSPRAALLLMGSGKPCSPADALDLGLADMVTPPGATYDEAVAFVKNNLHDTSRIGGTHGETTWRREAIRAMKDNVVAAEIFEELENMESTERRNFTKTWDLNAKTMVERREQYTGLRRAALKQALEDWSTVTDPFATTIPPDEDVGNGLFPTRQNTLLGRSRDAAAESFARIFARPAAKPVLSSPAGSDFRDFQNLLDK